MASSDPHPAVNTTDVVIRGILVLIVFLFRLLNALAGVGVDFGFNVYDRMRDDEQHRRSHRATSIAVDGPSVPFAPRAHAQQPQPQAMLGGSGGVAYCTPVVAPGPAISSGRAASGCFPDVSTAAPHGFSPPNRRSINLLST
jgi:hypothetical protein